MNHLSDIDNLMRGFEQRKYVADRPLATAIYLLLKLQRPLLIEGHAGVGKTETANVLASFLGTELIRLQCYEGLDVNSAVYEWNYQKQLLSIKIQEHAEASIAEKEKHIFSAKFLLERPLLRAISATNASPVLLIDEIDRADEEFEAFLLELLSDFQITIPEMGTIKATHVPYVVLTSNRTRELSDALRRRCLYHWIDYPSLEKELHIVHKKLPQIGRELANQIVQFIQAVRGKNLSKPPGIAETLDWTSALLSLEKTKLDEMTVEETLGCILKSNEDISKLKAENIPSILSQVES
ncbi:MAG: MoxR family ATPase [Ignavibacteriales bacterium]|nr:MoxR family ATPase [Ignavibacteriales bacterium]